MAGTARISNAQLVCAVTLSQHVAAVLFLPAIMANEAGRDAWMAPTVGLLVGALPSALLLGALIRYHPGRSFGEIAEHCLGRWVGKLVTLILALLSLMVVALCLEDVIVFIPTTVLPGTPGWAVGLGMALVVLYGAYQGGEVLVRAAVLVILALGAAYLFILVGLSPFYSVLHLSPLFEEGVMPVVKAGLVPAGWFAEIWFFAEFLALLDRPERGGRSLILGSVLGAVVLTKLALEGVMAFGADLVAHLAYPSYTLVQQLTLGEFMERLEVVIITLWLSGMIVKTGLYLWISHISLARVLGVKNARKLLPWLGATALGITFLNPNIISLFTLARTYWTPLALPLSVAIPGLLLVISWWKARAGRKQRDLGA